MVLARYRRAVSRSASAGSGVVGKKIGCSVHEHTKCYHAWGLGGVQTTYIVRTANTICFSQAPNDIIHFTMHDTATQNWLTALGYREDPQSLYTKPGKADSVHPYGREIDALLSNSKGVRASAVFNVDRMPTVCFVEATGEIQTDEAWLSTARQQIWNQSLVSLLLVVDGERLIPCPIQKEAALGTPLILADASANGPFSAADIKSGNVQQRLADWFSLESRVDRELLHNLRYGVAQLMQAGINRDSAQFLLGQCLFVSYLEHRQIVSPVYRARRNVGRLNDLITSRNAAGLVTLFDCLKGDFNGDFLDPGNAPQANWLQLSEKVYDLLDRFLSRVNIETGQGSLWNYDFRYIPVELISGIYETFLSDDKGALGAYYTPRHLANLAVDQAFLGSADVAQEVVYDAACGSGILLTTAFRRMISAAERQAGNALTFSARSKLLLRGIRGGDISMAACRLTAFSLYLSLMEDLQPSDILLLQDDEQTKLPTLIKKTILCGNDAGDFFSTTQNLANTRPCTVFLSNPPWYEPKKEITALPYETWADQHGLFLPHRQIAAAFAHKAIETTTGDGRVCLILPVKLFTAPTSQRFLQEWLKRCKIERIINFSDIRRLLFAKAIHPCVIVTCQRRSDNARGKIPYNEFIDYWVPKADISIAFGRLTIHGTDRKQLLSLDVWEDNQTLRTHLWGGVNDTALIGRLSLVGTVGDLMNGSNSRWQLVKGFNQNRWSSPPLSTKPLRGMRFLDTRNIGRDAPVLDLQVLRPFPDKIDSVVSYGSKDGAAFAGPRILFPDGTPANFQVNAVFTREHFCFKHSVAALRGPDDDEELIRFMTMYLRSSLAKYFLLHTAYSLAAERPRITLTEIRKLPFILPQQHAQPARAAEIVHEVAAITRAWESADVFEQRAHAASYKARSDELVLSYFELDERDILLVHDTCQTIIPSVQPSGYDAIRTAYCAPSTEDDIKLHASWLERELGRWKTVLGGDGALEIETMLNHPGTVGALGIVRIALSPQQNRVKVRINNRDVAGVVESLRTAGLLPAQAWANLYLSADFLIHANEAMYLIKPLVKRLWLPSQALNDAQRIVDAVQHSPG